MDTESAAVTADTVAPDAAIKSETSDAAATNDNQQNTAAAAEFPVLPPPVSIEQLSSSSSSAVLSPLEPMETHIPDRPWCHFSGWKAFVR